MDWFYYALLLALLLAGFLINILGLPGLWVMVACHIAYAWGTDWQYAGLGSILILVSLGLLAELAEFLAGSLGAGKAGASRRAMIGAFVGAFIGAIALTPMIPVPVLGTVVGACAGAFLGAGVVELWIRRQWIHSARVGWGAAKGRFMGIVLKLLFGLVMLVVSVWTALPIAGVVSADFPSGPSPMIAPAPTAPATPGAPVDETPASIGV